MTSISCLCEDNEGEVQLAQNPVCTSNSKNIGIRYRFLREPVFQRELDIISVKSEMQHADFWAKPSSKETFCFHADFLTDI